MGSSIDDLKQLHRVSTQYYTIKKLKMDNLEHLEFWRPNSGMGWCVGIAVPDILKHHSAYIFMVKQSAVAADHTLSKSATRY